ncbi:unnamed protein product, partial [Discosporangium mesarthrocarpum]
GDWSFSRGIGGVQEEEESLARAGLGPGAGNGVGGGGRTRSSTESSTSTTRLTPPGQRSPPGPGGLSPVAISLSPRDTPGLSPGGAVGLSPGRGTETSMFSPPLRRTGVSPVTPLRPGGSSSSPLVPGVTGESVAAAAVAAVVEETPIKSEYSLPLEEMIDTVAVPSQVEGEGREEPEAAGARVGAGGEGEPPCPGVKAEGLSRQNLWAETGSRETGGGDEGDEEKKGTGGSLERRGDDGTASQGDKVIHAKDVKAGAGAGAEVGATLEGLDGKDTQERGGKGDVLWAGGSIVKSEEDAKAGTEPTGEELGDESSWLGVSMGDSTLTGAGAGLDQGGEGESIQERVEFGARAKTSLEEETAAGVGEASQLGVDMDKEPKVGRGQGWGGGEECAVAERGEPRVVKGLAEALEAAIPVDGARFSSGGGGGQQECIEDREGDRKGDGGEGLFGEAFRLSGVGMFNDDASDVSGEGGGPGSRRPSTFFRSALSIGDNSVASRVFSSQGSLAAIEPVVPQPVVPLPHQGEGDTMPPPQQYQLCNPRYGGRGGGRGGDGGRGVPPKGSLQVEEQEIQEREQLEPCHDPSGHGERYSIALPDHSSVEAEKGEEDHMPSMKSCSARCSAGETVSPSSGLHSSASPGKEGFVVGPGVGEGTGRDSDLGSGSRAGLSMREAEAPSNLAAGGQHGQQQPFSATSSSPPSPPETRSHAVRLGTGELSGGTGGGGGEGVTHNEGGAAVSEQSTTGLLSSAPRPAAPAVAAPVPAMAMAICSPPNIRPSGRGDSVLRRKRERTA